MLVRGRRYFTTDAFDQISLPQCEKFTSGIRWNQRRQTKGLLCISPKPTGLGKVMKFLLFRSKLLIKHIQIMAVSGTLSSVVKKMKTNEYTVSGKSELTKCDLCSSERDKHNFTPLVEI